jgi:predicted TIM-barrel fold metal-dependent hydrolase
MMKIDIHCHTTKRPLEEVEGSAFIDRIEQEMERNGIIHTVILASYFPHRGSGISNYRLYNWIKDSPNFSMFGSFDAEHYFKQGLSELEELAQTKKMKGIKVYSGYQRIAPRDLRLVANIASNANIPLMFHGGHTHRIDTLPPRASDLLAIVGDMPIDIIISHLATPHTDDLARMVNKRPGTYADMSGLFISKTERHELPSAIATTRKFLDACGPDKLIFGTDFPVQSHEDAIAVVEGAMGGYDAAAREKVYYGNARRLLWRVPPISPANRFAYSNETGEEYE